jgi:hypothetical protein
MLKAAESASYVLPETHNGSQSATNQKGKLHFPSKELQTPAEY